MNRAPYVVAGVVLAVLFGFESYKVLVREPAHARASIAGDDYPLEAGLTWVYKSAAGIQVVRRVVESPVKFLRHRIEDDGITGDRLPDPEDRTYFEMQYDLPLLGRKKLLMRRTPEGVIARRDDGEQLTMKFPMRTGDSWTIDFPNEDLAECTVLAPEEIDVLSKRALASKLRVVRTNRKTGKKTTDYEWYVRGIGLAQMEVTFGLKATFSLIRFERADSSPGNPPGARK